MPQRKNSKPMLLVSEWLSSGMEIDGPTLDHPGTAPYRPPGFLGTRSRMPNDTLRPVRTALLSVHDKTGLVPFARALAARGVVLISTGGTAKALGDAGLKVAEVATITNFPEMLDGRVKTLHPAIHGGLLARRDDAAHIAAIRQHGIEPIDLLVSNLYPFAATVARGAG